MRNLIIIVHELGRIIKPALYGIRGNDVRRVFQRKRVNGGENNINTVQYRKTIRQPCLAPADSLNVSCIYLYANTVHNFNS